VAVVHLSRTGHGVQVAVSNLTTIASVPRWVHRLQLVFTAPWGQVSCSVSQLMVNAAVV